MMGEQIMTMSRVYTNDVYGYRGEGGKGEGGMTIETHEIHGLWLA